MGSIKIGTRSNIWKYIRNYKFNSLFIRYFLMIMCSAIIPLVLVAVLLNSFYYNALEEEISNTYKNSISQTRDSLETVLYEIHRLGLSLALDKNMELTLNSTDIDNSDYLQITRMVSVTQSVELPEALYSFIDSTYAYSEKNGYLFTSMAGLWNAKSYPERSWMNSYDENNKKYVYWYDTRKAVNTQDTGSTKDVITAFYSVPLFGENKTGAVMINLDTDKLSSYLFGSGMKYNEIYLIDEYNRIILSSHKGLMGESISKIDGNINESVLVNGFSQILKTDGIEKVYSTAVVEQQNWKLVFAVPLSEYAKKINDIRSILILFIILSVIISIVISFLICRRVFLPIDEIITTLGAPKELVGDETDNAYVNRNELKFILSNITRTCSRNAYMEGKLNEYVARLKSAQTYALQAQIKPHFIYNTLETINWLAVELTRSENNASRMISTLSRLLRYVLENNSSMEQIKSEIEYTKQYIEIQKVRYNNKFDVLWEVDENIYGFMIAKITLQPLVENAIIHGIKPKEGQGFIIIQALRQENNIRFTITDNGVGIPEKALIDIKKGIRNTLIQSDESIGVNNVNFRLKLIFGEPYGLDIDSVEGRYTTVGITVPVIVS